MLLSPRNFSLRGKTKEKVIEMGLISNRVDRSSLKPGDHIYSWRSFIYAHHGIYVGDNKVIHFTRGRGQEVATGTALDLLIGSSLPTGAFCPQSPPCNSQEVSKSHGVITSCLDCFLAGHGLYRFEYSVSRVLFIASRSGTCSLAKSDPDDKVVHRATCLLSNGFGCYNASKNNCEHFAVYCKTELVISDQGTSFQLPNGQASSLLNASLPAVLNKPVRLLTTNIYVRAAAHVGVYCVTRYYSDISTRPDVERVAVEEFC